MLDGGKSRIGIPIWSYAVTFCIVLLALPWIGAERLSWSEVFAFLQGESTAHGLILFRQRIPRVLLALLVGGSLSVTGAALQILFRNPLAEPWTLGVSGGAAVGAFVAYAVPTLHVGIGPLHSSQVLALVGAASVLGLIIAFSQRRKGVTMDTLLLGGVTISVLSGGIMMLAIYFISPFKFISFNRWLMGGLDVVGYRELWSFLMLVVPGLVLLMGQTHEYNHLALGEDMAMGHGVDVLKIQRMTLVGAGLITAACVAIAGPIGFVAMIIPHVVRRLSGFDNRVVVPCAFLLGGTVLALCDAAARTVIAPTEIPVGVITAVIGGPVFLYLLARK